MKHLYVHMPFCRSRCAYCDFAAEPIAPHARARRVQHYLSVLRSEMSACLGVEAQGGGGLHAVGEAGDRLLETAYVGGGTPTVLPADDLVALVSEISTWTAAGAEVTVEANPGTIDRALLESLVTAGMTRLSLGVQSFSAELRTALGRRVTQREITEALEVVTAVPGLDWNLDLVFGIPGQDWEAAAADVERSIAAAPGHISLYDLTWTPRYAARVERTCGAGAREAAGAFAEEHYAHVCGRLEAAGYRRYEVSNFALPGHECRHNQAYWRGEDYLGVGASAVSTVSVGWSPPAVSPDSAFAGLSAAERRTNPRSVEGYLAGEPAQVETLSPLTRLWERAMLGLRTREGVDESTSLPVIDGAAFDRLLATGCVERAHGRIRLNPAYLDVSNAVIGTLLVEAAVPVDMRGL